MWCFLLLSVMEQIYTLTIIIPFNLYNSLHRCCYPCLHKGKLSSDNIYSFQRQSQGLRTPPCTVRNHFDINDSK